MARTPADDPGASTHRAISPDLPGGSDLARRILRRYVGRPGILPLAATFGLADRVSRIGAGRSSLATEIFRRWIGDAPPDDSPRRPVLAPPHGTNAGPTVGPATTTDRPHADPDRPVARPPRSSAWPVDAWGAAEPSATARPAPAAHVPPSSGELESPIRRRPRATLGPTIQRSAVPDGARLTTAAPIAAPPPPTSPEPPAAIAPPGPSVPDAPRPPASAASHRSRSAGPNPVAQWPDLALAWATPGDAGGRPEAASPADARPPRSAGSGPAASATVVPDGGASAGSKAPTVIPSGRSSPLVPRVARAVDRAASASREPGLAVRQTAASPLTMGPIRRERGAPVDGPLVLSAAPSPSGPAIARQHEPGPVVPMPVASPPASSAAPMTSAERELDVEALVDRVLRKLTRQLAVEGERRGWQRWP